MNAPTIRDELHELQRPSLIERYRVALQSLAGSPSLSVSLERD